MICNSHARIIQMGAHLYQANTDSFKKITKYAKRRIHRTACDKKENRGVTKSHFKAVKEKVVWLLSELPYNLP